MYTEQIIYLKPNSLFDRLAIRQQQLELDVWMELSGIQIPSVIILKKPLENMPAGTKLFWAVGDNNSMDAYSAFGPKQSMLKGTSCFKIEFIPPVSLGDIQEICRGIDFDSDESSENEWLKRYPTRQYVCFHIPKAAYRLGNL